MAPSSCSGPGQISETSGILQRAHSGLQTRGPNPTLGILHCRWDSWSHHSFLHDRLHVLIRQCQSISRRSHSTNQDREYCHAQLREAYHQASQSFMTSRTSSRTLMELWMSSCNAKISAIQVTAARIRELDDQIKHAVSAMKRQKKLPTAPLREVSGEQGKAH